LPSVLWTLPVAVAVFGIVFAWRPANFWLLMAAGTALLAALALALRGDFLLGEGIRPGDLLLGAGSAALLYGVFYAGRFLVPRSQVGAVYDIRAHAPAGVIAALLLLVIGPAEEIYWRGLVQHALAAVLPGWPAVVAAASVYAAVHLVARNPTLVLAALVGGLYWGGLYLLAGRIFPVVVSHALWDVSVLLLFPLR
jgi:membrane protease YdiL (CAAX protease family)